MLAFAAHDNLNQLLASVLTVWPEHEKAATKSIAHRSEAVLATSDSISDQILRLSRGVEGGMETLSADYRFLCEHIIMPEELYFRRNGHYRLSRFEDADQEVYSNCEYMNRYMNGLLLSGVLWSNHAQAIDHYVREFLASSPKGAKHLEIGPGHGLLLYFASLAEGLSEIHGWDVSTTSVANTRNALNHLGVEKPINLRQRNLLETPSGDDVGAYDSLVLSEILEHIEDPVGALASARRVLKPGGRAWISVPANSPAPDHLFLFQSPEHACEVVEQAGLSVADWAAFPMAGTNSRKSAQGKAFHFLRRHRRQRSLRGRPGRADQAAWTEAATLLSRYKPLSKSEAAA